MSQIGRVIIPGGTGNAGQSFLKQFASQGWDIQSTTRSQDRFSQIEQHGAKALQLDFLDESSVKRFAREVSPADVLVLNAGTLEGKSKAHLHEVNAEGPKRLLRALQEEGKLPRRVIMMSSMLVSGPNRGVTEEERYRIGGPLKFGLGRFLNIFRSHYGDSKAAGEAIAYEIFTDAFGTDEGFVSLRPGAILGPNDRVTLPSMIAPLKGLFHFLGIYPNMTWGLNPKVSFISSNDVAAIGEHVARKQLETPQFGVYDIEDGQGGYTLKDIGDAGKKVFGTKHVANLRFLPIGLLTWSLGALGQSLQRVFGKKATPLDLTRILELSDPDNFASNERLYADFPELREHQFEKLADVLEHSAKVLGKI